MTEITEERIDRVTTQLRICYDRAMAGGVCNDHDYISRVRPADLLEVIELLRESRAEVERLRGRFDETEIYNLYGMAREKVLEAEKLNDADAIAYRERIWSKLGDMLVEARESEARDEE